MKIILWMFLATGCSSRAFSGDGECNGYLSLDGTGSTYISNSLDLRAPFTVEAEFETTPEQTLYVSKRCTEPVGGWGLGVTEEGNSVTAVIYGKSVHIVEVGIVDTGWRHVAWVFDGEESRLYLDGFHIGSLPSVADVSSCSEPVYVGLLDRFQAGNVDELRVSNVIRYTENFEPAERHETDASTLGLWHFDDCS